MSPGLIPGTRLNSKISKVGITSIKPNQSPEGPNRAQGPNQRGNSWFECDGDSGWVTTEEGTCVDTGNFNEDSTESIPVKVLAIAG